MLACHLKIDADLVPDTAYHFDADRDFYLMRIRVNKMMRIHNTGWIRIHRRVSLYSGLLPKALAKLCFSSTLPCPDGVECHSRSKQHYLQFRYRKQWQVSTAGNYSGISNCNFFPLICPVFERYYSTKVLRESCIVRAQGEFISPGFGSDNSRCQAE